MQRHKNVQTQPIIFFRWVRDHISNFGGNGKSVTIMGHSAGGASVEYQVLSPRSKGILLIGLLPLHGLS